MKHLAYTFFIMYVPDHLLVLFVVLSFDERISSTGLVLITTRESNSLH